jgi:1-acyl-sn-glycerol-3-phosphate acyltransferase
MKLLAAGWKLLQALWHVVAGWFTIVLVFPRLHPQQRQIRVQVWARKMLVVLGIALHIRGTPPLHGPVLLVANHISWLDILVMHAARHCRFVSKSEVRHWPLIGTLSTGAGTLYIERESRRDAMRVVQQMANALRGRDILAVFPEGTTSNGIELLAFHGNLIQAAILADAPVQPVALSLIDQDSGQPSLAPCYIQDDTLLGSIWRTLSAARIAAVVTYGQAQNAQGRGRRAWAEDLRAEVLRLRG